jgi:hypothetical protein
MGFSENEGHVRCEIFRDRNGGAGKWYTTIALDMSKHYHSGVLRELLEDAIINALKEQLDEIDTASGPRRRFGGMWAVVLDPYHEHAHPMIVRIPE